MRLVDEEGPQGIGMRRPFVVVAECMWREKSLPEKPLGRWLIENMPRGTNLEIPRDRTSTRAIPFIDDHPE